MALEFRSLLMVFPFRLAEGGVFAKKDTFYCLSGFGANFLNFCGALELRLFIRSNCGLRA